MHLLSIYLFFSLLISLIIQYVESIRNAFISGFDIFGHIMSRCLYMIDEKGLAILSDKKCKKVTVHSVIFHLNT